MKLRLYQDSFTKTLADYLTRFKRIIGQLPTGGGKTVVFANICNRYLKKANKDGILPGTGKTIVIAVHRKELLQQTRRTCYKSFKITCQPVISGMKYIPPADVYVCMVETLSRLLRKKKPKNLFGNIGILIIDEAHRLEFMKLHQHFTDTYIIGFSATPITASKKKPLKDYYEDIVCGPGIMELIKDGHLSQNITYAPKDTVDRIKLAQQKGGIIGNDFNEGLMGLEFSKVKYVHNTVTAYKKWASGTKCIVFNVNIAHSQVVTKAFVDAGLNARHIDGEMDDKERDRIIKWFHDTKDAILCNVGIVTTGFDEPTIESVIINRATMSLPLWIQMTGRGSRAIDVDFISKNQLLYPYDLTPKKVFTIIDMGGNAITHGDWCQDRDWYDLFHNPPKPGKSNVAPVKICPKCFAVVPASTRTCAFCGYQWPTKEIGVEIDLHEFIVVTKGIDVQAIIDANKFQKDYYSLFKIGTTLAHNAKKTIDEMNHEYANFILERYFVLGKDWMKIKFPHKRFNDWHRIKCKEHLYFELKKAFPIWNYTPPPTPEQISKDFHINNIQAIEKLHYE